MLACFASSCRRKRCRHQLPSAPPAHPLAPAAYGARSARKVILSAKPCAAPPPLLSPSAARAPRIGLVQSTQRRRERVADTSATASARGGSTRCGAQQTRHQATCSVRCASWCVTRGELMGLLPAGSRQPWAQQAAGSREPGPGSQARRPAPSSRGQQHACSSCLIARWRARARAQAAETASCSALQTILR